MLHGPPPSSLPIYFGCGAGVICVVGLAPSYLPACVCHACTCYLSCPTCWAAVVSKVKSDCLHAHGPAPRQWQCRPGCAARRTPARGGAPRLRPPRRPDMRWPLQHQGEMLACRRTQVSAGVSDAIACHAQLDCDRSRDDHGCREVFVTHSLPMSYKRLRLQLSGASSCVLHGLLDASTVQLFRLEMT